MTDGSTRSAHSTSSGQAGLPFRTEDKGQAGGESWFVGQGLSFLEIWRNGGAFD